MDPSAFDTLVRSFATADTRRRVLARLVAALPLAGTLAAREDGPGANAAHPVARIQQRRDHHRTRARRR